jgi:hypothetical protein
MYSLTVIFGPETTSLRFLFRKKEAMEAMMHLRIASPNTEWKVSDDFGQTAEFKAGIIHAVVAEDLSSSLMAAVEMGLHQARVQAKAQEMAQQDPMLRNMARGGGNSRGPGIISPHFPQ